MARRMHWGRIGAAVAVVTVGLAAILVILAATDPDSGSFGLPCEEVGVATLEEGDLRASTPEEAVLKTEWLDQLRVPEEARIIVTDDSTPRNGIVPLPAEDDEGATDSEATARRAYQIYVDGISTAHVVIALSEAGTYFVSQIAYC